MLSLYLLCAKLVREFAPGMLHPYPHVTDEETAAHSWSRDLNPQFAGAKQRPMFFPLLPPASLVWEVVRARPWPRCLSACPLYPPSLCSPARPSSPSQGRGRLLRLAAESLGPRLPLPLPSWDGLLKPFILLLLCGGRCPFPGGLSLDSHVILCPQEGEGSWPVGKVAGVSPQNQVYPAFDLCL